MLNTGHIFKPFEIESSLDCGIKEAICSTNKYLLKKNDKNAIDANASIINSNLTYCTVSKNCTVNNSKLHNVIMLPGSKVLNQNLENTIIGFDECLEGSI